MPERFQLHRSRGRRKPPGSVVVSRPSKWGNPFRVGVDGDAAECARAYRLALVGSELDVTVADVRRELGGRDLACWCPPGAPCHGDVLLALANDS